ncbi:MAG: hypothetical protein AB7H80_17200, partial [Candidatus Kapaibacterium sp.]
MSFALFLPFSLALLLYLVTMQTSFFWGDALDEVRAATASERYVPPQHLISSTVNAGVLALSGVRTENGSFILLQILMIIATLVGASGLLLLLKRLSVDRGLLFGIIGLYFLANGIWYHGSTVETGAIPLALLVWSLYWLLRNETPTPKDIIVSFSFVSLSVLFNLQQALFIPLFLLYVIVRQRLLTDRFRSFATISTTVLLTGLLPYLLIAQAAHSFSSIPEFIAWVTYNPHIEIIGKMKDVSLESATRSISGMFALVVEPRGATSWLKFVMRENTNVPIDPVMLLRLIVPAALLIFVVIGSLLSFRQRRDIGLLAVLSTASCFLFGYIWLGSDPQFWLPAWPLLLLSAGIGFTPLIAAGKLSRTTTYTTISVALLLLLFLNTPQTSPSLLFQSGGEEFQAVCQFSDSVESADLVIAPGGRWGTYFAKLRPEVAFINLELDTNGVMGTEGEEFTAVLRERIEPIVERGNKVFIDGGFETREVLLSSPWDGFRLKHDLSREELMDGLRQFNQFTLLDEGSRNGIA